MDSDQKDHRSAWVYENGEKMAFSTVKGTSADTGLIEKAVLDIRRQLEGG